MTDTTLNNFPFEPVEPEDFDEAEGSWSETDENTEADSGTKGGSATGVWDPTAPSWQSILASSEDDSLIDNQLDDRIEVDSEDSQFD